MLGIGVCLGPPPQGRGTLSSEERERVREEWEAKVDQDGFSLLQAPRWLQTDIELGKRAVRQNPFVLEVLDPFLRGDCEVVREAVSKAPSAFEYAMPPCTGDLALVQEVVRVRGSLLSKAEPRLWGNKSLVLEALRSDGEAFGLLAEQGSPLCYDEEVVRAALESCGLMLEYVDFESMRVAISGRRPVPKERSYTQNVGVVVLRLITVIFDRVFPTDLAEVAKMKEAAQREVSQSMRAYTSCIPDPEQEREYREVTNLLVNRLLYQREKSGIDLEKREKIEEKLVSLFKKALGRPERFQEWRAQRHMLIASALAQNGYALKFAEGYQGDPEMVKLAIRSSGGGVLMHALSFVRRDREVALEAVASEGRALSYLLPPVSEDPDVVKTALENDKQALEFVSPSTPGYREIVLALVLKDPSLLRYAPTLRQDPSFLETLKRYPHVQRWLSLSRGKV